MNNILTYEKYRSLVKLSESLAYRDYESEDAINEGLLTNFKKKISSKMVNKVLGNEIEQGKKFEETLHDTIKDLRDAYDKLSAKRNERSATAKKIAKILDDISNMHFDAMSLLTDADIDFGGFVGDIVLANTVNLFVLLSPVKNPWMIKKAYNYFMLLIKQAVHNDLVMLQINFDQFQNLILKNAEEIKDEAENSSERKKWIEVGMDYCKDFSMALLGKKKKLSESEVNAFIKFKESRMKDIDRDRKENAILDIMNRYNDNTFRSTAESLKSYIHDDTQKEVDSIKNAIAKIASGDEHLTVYGELLISAAEEHALKAVTAIHTNFLKMSEVFKLSNQKQLVELIKEAEETEQARIDKDKKDKELKDEADKEQKSIDDGEKFFNKHLGSSTDIKKMSVSDWFDVSEDDRKNTEKYLSSSKGIKKYDNITKHNMMLASAIMNPKSPIIEIIDDLSLMEVHAGMIDIKDKEDVKTIYDALRIFRSEYYKFDKSSKQAIKELNKKDGANKNKKDLIKIIGNIFGKDYPPNVANALGRLEKSIQCDDTSKPDDMDVYFDEVKHEKGPFVDLSDSSRESVESFLKDINRYITTGSAEETKKK